jgi:hypothetical protein
MKWRCPSDQISCAMMVALIGTESVAARRFQAGDEIRSDPGDVAMRFPHVEWIGGDLYRSERLGQRQTEHYVVPRGPRLLLQHYLLRSHAECGAGVVGHDLGFGSASPGRGAGQDQDRRPPGVERANGDPAPPTAAPHSSCRHWRRLIAG